jgi:hypothetical protein
MKTSNERLERIRNHFVTSVIDKNVNLASQSIIGKETNLVMASWGEICGKKDCIQTINMCEKS